MHFLIYMGDFERLLRRLYNWPKFGVRMDCIGALEEAWKHAL